MEEASSSRDALEDVAKTSREQGQKTSGATSRDDIKVDENAEASTRANWKQPLKELSEATGGFAVLDANDYRKPMARLAADLGGFYEITYASAGATWDGAFRSTEVKVSRGGTKVQHGNGYIATPPDDAGPILAYEMPLLEALKSAEPRKDFPIAAGTFAFGSTPEGREVTLVAETPISSFKVTTDPKAKLYKLHFALLALVKDEGGKTVERVSQDYPFQGPLDKLPQLQQGNVVFKRKIHDCGLRAAPIGQSGRARCPVTRHCYGNHRNCRTLRSRLRAGGLVMQDIMIRIETDDFEAWKTQHYLHADNRAAFGISDGPAYQDIDNPNAALFHIMTDDMDRAMQWFKSDVFKEASRLAKVTGRVFFLAQPQA